MVSRRTFKRLREPFADFQSFRAGVKFPVSVCQSGNFRRFIVTVQQIVPVFIRTCRALLLKPRSILAER